MRGFVHVSRKPRAARLDDQPLVHEDVEVADLAREVQLVGDDHHRHARLRELAHDGEDLTDELGVESRRRLVEQHHFGIEAQRPRDRNALRLATRELRGIVRRPVEQADLVQATRCSGLGLGAAEALRRAKRARDVVERRQVRKEVELLEHHADVSAQLQRPSTLQLSPPSPGPYSTPSTRTDPSLGSSSRLIVRSSVDFPEPDGPKMTTCSPACTERSTPWSTSLSPYDFLIPRSSTTAAPCRADQMRDRWMCRQARGSTVGLGVFVRIAAGMCAS